ncbi:hypothetical protein TMLG_02311, partial [Mycobacterium tuberculosis SUMu012]
ALAPLPVHSLSRL